MDSNTEAMKEVMQKNDKVIRDALTELEEFLLEIILDVKKYGSSEQINAVRAMLHNAMSKINDRESALSELKGVEFEIDTLTTAHPQGGTRAKGGESDERHREE